MIKSFVIDSQLLMNVSASAVCIQYLDACMCPVLKMTGLFVSTVCTAACCVFQIFFFFFFSAVVSVSLAPPLPAAADNQTEPAGKFSINHLQFLLKQRRIEEPQSASQKGGKV